ncbi:hypothetical protein [Pleomorphovibrio marinus]|uniref:hypothetical protein n=1 Tax=Pleomorphovibrio marinus TaxID=2164132 RepID=UPI000E0C9E33|nr:hypothetical protein [Pleomorphovibrio marinus]
MKKFKSLVLIALVVLVSCQEQEVESVYSGRSLSYDLFQSSDFDYKGLALVRELKSGDLEIEIDMEGPGSVEEYFFAGHLHFGTYDAESADIAYLLNPVDIRSLNSKTILGQLSNGEKLDFESFKSFDGHIKIHLAEEGPDYSIILVSGNIGANPNSIESFDRNKITLCTPYYPEN